MDNLVRLLEAGKWVYVAKAEFARYEGSLISGDTEHFILKPDSVPIFSLSYEDNETLGTVKPEEYIHYVTIYTERQERPWIRRGYKIYFSTRPFSVWIRHRGYSGDNCDDYDRLVDSVPLTSKEELITYLRKAGAKSDNEQ